MTRAVMVRVMVRTGGTKFGGRDSMLPLQKSSCENAAAFRQVVVGLSARRPPPPPRRRASAAMATPATSSRMTRAQARAMGVDVAATPAAPAPTPATGRRGTARRGAAAQPLPLAEEVAAAVRAAAGASPVAQKLFSAPEASPRRAFGTPLHNTTKARRAAARARARQAGTAARRDARGAHRAPPRRARRD
jgi:hypothetical protein